MPIISRNIISRKRMAVRFQKPRSPRKRQAAPTIRVLGLFIQKSLAFSTWKERDVRAKTGNTIDAFQRKLLDAEKERWKSVFFRMVEVIKFFAKQSIPFRGDNQRLGDSSNGNFMQLLETIAKFDPIMSICVLLSKTNRKATKHTLSFVGHPK